MIKSYFINRHRPESNLHCFDIFFAFFLACLDGEKTNTCYQKVVVHPLTFLSNDWYLVSRRAVVFLSPCQCDTILSVRRGAKGRVTALSRLRARLAFAKARTGCDTRHNAPPSDEYWGVQSHVFLAKYTRNGAGNIGGQEGEQM
jgi:hypothetical protein